MAKGVILNNLAREDLLRTYQSEGMSKDNNGGMHSAQRNSKCKGPEVAVPSVTKGKEGQSKPGQPLSSSPASSGAKPPHSNLLNKLPDQLPEGKTESHPRRD